MSKSKGFLTGVIVGATLGAVGALLSSPKKGAELRKELKKKVSKYSPTLEKFIGDMEQKGKFLGQEVSTIKQELMDKGLTLNFDFKAKDEEVEGGKEQVVSSDDEDQDSQDTAPDRSRKSTQSSTPSKTYSDKQKSRRYFKGI